MRLDHIRVMSAGDDEARGRLWGGGGRVWCLLTELVATLVSLSRARENEKLVCVCAQKDEIWTKYNKGEKQYEITSWYMRRNKSSSKNVYQSREKSNLVSLVCSCCQFAPANVRLSRRAQEESWLLWHTNVSTSLTTFDTLESSNLITTKKCDQFIYKVSVIEKINCERKRESEEEKELLP